MPSWSIIAAHLKEEAGKYIVIGLVTVASAIVLLTWHWIEANAGAAILDFAAARLADPDPDNYLEDGKTHERDGNYARAIRNFQTKAMAFGKMLVEADPEYFDTARTKPRPTESTVAIRQFQTAVLHKFATIIATEDPTYIDKDKKIFRNALDAAALRELLDSLHSAMKRDITQVTRGFVGYVQTGDFDLSTNTAEAQAKPGSVESTTFSPNVENKIPKAEHSFGIFGGRSSHVYLELTIGNYDTRKFDIQVFFFNQSFCSPRRLGPGFNAIEFEITDLTRHGIRSTGGTCQPDKKDRAETALVSSSEEAMTERIANKGHQDQLIPVTFKIVPVGSSRADKEVTLKQALQNAPTQQNGAQVQEKVTIGYIAVVSPLVEDSLVK